MDDVKEVVEQKETIDSAFNGASVEAAKPEPSPWSDFTPSKYGLDARYDTLKPDQFAKEIQFRNQTFGKQTQELGELRRKTQEYEQKLAKFMEAADKPIEMAKASKGLDEFAKEKFYKLLEQGRPDEALEIVLADKLKPKFDGEDFQKAVDARVQEHLNKYNTYASEESIKRDPDYPAYSDYMDVLKQPEHFGGNRRPEELLAFSKLVSENKPMADITYDYMKRYPNMNFDDAKKFAGLTLNNGTVTEQKKDQLKKQLDKLEGVSPAKGGSKPSGAEGKITSMDDAFNVD